MNRAALILLLALVAWGCGDAVEQTSDAGQAEQDAAAVDDAGEADSGLADAGQDDAGEVDSGFEEPDAGERPHDCSQGNGGCDPLTTCTMVAGAPSCGGCPEHFEGDGESGCRCVPSATPYFQLRDQPSLPNIALGKPYVMDPAPNYALCSDPGDATQLTDGVRTTDYFWTQSTTVGWQAPRPTVVIDLGSERAIRGLSYSTAAGVAEVEWPSAIYLFVAGEDRELHLVGDLVELHERHAVPPEMGTYERHTFWTDALETHGRYVALTVANDQFAFVDEIEVYEGDSAWMSNPLPGAGFSDLDEAVEQASVVVGTRRRILGDMRALIRRAEETAAPAGLRNSLHCELDSVVPALDHLPAPAADFRAELPLNRLHARVMRNQARLWWAQGVSGLVAWAGKTWETQPWLSDPPAPSGDGVQVVVRLAEHRGARVLIGNAGPRPSTVSLHVRGFRDGDDPWWITAHQVAWTDTRSLTPVSQALPEPVRSADGGTRVEIPAGTVREVWLDVHPEAIADGVFSGQITFEGGPEIDPVPITVDLRPYFLPRFGRLAVGGFDYTNGGPLLGVTDANRTAFIAMLREHLIDMPWATGDVMPAGSYDSSGYMSAPPPVDALEEWMARWYEARRYQVFASVGDSFAGFPAGSIEFETAVGEWANFWAEQFGLRDVDPSRVGILLVDEPSTEAQDATIAAWAQAIHATGFPFTVWEDVVGDPSGRSELISECDALCPSFEEFVEGSEAFRDFYRSQRDAGKKLELYSRTGPARRLDPYAYYRMHAWTAFAEGSRAIHYWAFGDNGDASSWNEYALTRPAYTPLFLDETSVVSGKQLEAIREGIEDYETLGLLQDAIAEARSLGIDPAVIGQAEAVLERVPGEVLATVGTAKWADEPLDREAADRGRVEVLEAVDLLVQSL